MIERIRYSLECPVVISGIGIHTGIVSSCRLLPTDSCGLYIKHTSPSSSVNVQRIYSRNYTYQKRTSAITAERLRVTGPEHVLGLLKLAGIDAAVIEIPNYCEFPCATGRGLGILRMLHKAGRKIISCPKEYKSIQSGMVQLVEQQRSYQALLGDASLFEVTMNFEGCPSATATLSIHNPTSSTVTVEQVANARTWIMEENLNAYQAEGLCLGVPNSGCQILKRDDLRDPSVRMECVCHKLLDLLGDLYTLDLDTGLNVRAVNPNHRLNTMLLHKISAMSEARK